MSSDVNRLRVGFVGALGFVGFVVTAVPRVAIAQPASAAASTSPLASPPPPPPVPPPPGPSAPGASPAAATPPFALATASETGAPGALHLAAAVQLALTRNERAQISDLNVEVAQAAVQRAVSTFLPVLAVGGNETIRPKRTDDTGKETNRPGVGTGAATLTAPIVNPSAFPLLAQARNARDAQLAQTVDDKRLLAFDAAHSFFTVLTAEAVLEASQRAFETAKDNLADTQARVDAQLNSSNDATRAQIDLANSARQVEVNKGNVQNAFTELSYTVNARIENQVVVPEGLLRASEQPLAPITSLVSFGLKHRPDVEARRLSAVAAHDFADEPLYRLIPSLAVTAQANATTAPGTGSPTVDEQLQLNANWTIFDNGTRYADRRSRLATAKIAELTTHALVRTVDSEVKTAYASLASAQAAFRVAKEAFQAAKQSSEETAILYREGLAKAIELVDANDTRLVSEVQYVSAQYAMAQAYLDMRQALGLEPLGTELK